MAKSAIAALLEQEFAAAEKDIAERMKHDLNRAVFDVQPWFLATLCTRDGDIEAEEKITVIYPTIVHSFVKVEKGKRIDHFNLYSKKYRIDKYPRGPYTYQPGDRVFYTEVLNAPGASYYYEERMPGGFRAEEEVF